MKKFLKISSIGLLLLFVGIFIFGYRNHETLPKGQKGTSADVLAQQILHALNKKAYDATKIIEWSFKGNHHYKWYKQEHKVEVTWHEHKVILFTKTPEKSTAYLNGIQTNDEKLITKAISYFNNDSFWLVAPYKILDAGTERSIVKYQGKDALLVTYTSGGSTPGDSYLWLLNDNYIPIAYKMWVGIIPVGGLEATWSNWITTEAGCLLPTTHTLSLVGLEIDMGTVKAYN